MNAKNIFIKLDQRSHSYKVKVGNNLLKTCGVWAKENLSANVQKIAIVSNEKVFGLYGKWVEQSCVDKGFELCVWLMEDGEEFKNFDSFQTCLSFFSDNKLKRTDAVLALGGGVVGDLAGFAAATYLRGLDFLQIPTTVLSMIDSSVGGKTAINTSFGKNLVGSFYQPNGVLIDVETLRSLEHREVIAGFCEVAKHGAIGGKELLNEVSEFLKKYSLQEFPSYFTDENFKSQLEKLFASQVRFKAEIVMQDEQESTGRSDVKSRKILNFGHTVAHALEKITDYKYFKHGEAVGYGMLVAGEISKKLDICDENSINLLKDVVRLVGVLPDTNKIDVDGLLELFVFDKKLIGNSLQWVVLEDIGKPKILSSQKIPQEIIVESLQKILHS